MRIDRLTVFNHLWAIAGFCEWTRWTFSGTRWSWGLLVGSLVLFIFPNSVLALALFAGTQVAFAALASDHPWNHGLLMALMNVAILASIARGAIRRQGAEGLVDTFAPAMRLSLIAVYLLTFFHKLNVDFLNPDVSCAGVMLSWINRSYRMLPLEEWAVVAAIWSTLFVELAVPLLLCFRRSVYLGLVIGAAFHLVLSQYGGLHGFAAVVFAVYFLFLPEAFTVALARRLSALLNGLDSTALRWAGLPAIAAGMLVMRKPLGQVLGIDSTSRGLLFWDVWLLGVIVVLRRELARVWRLPADFTLRQRWKPLGLIPLVVLLNGVSPYVGLKTETSWAMYSNLRTEVRPNHVIVPASAKVFGYQDDLVEIVESSLPALEQYARSTAQLTFFEFRRLCSSATRDFTVSYRRNDVSGTLALVDGVASDPAMCDAPAWLVGKLLHFRPVDTGAHATCRH